MRPGDLRWIVEPPTIFNESNHVISSIFIAN